MAQVPGGNLISVFFVLLIQWIFLFATNTIRFFFYCSFFGLLLGPLAQLVIFPINVLAAATILIFCLRYQIYERFERWVVYHYLSRILFLLAHLAAGVLAGRLLGNAAFDAVAADGVSPVVFQLIGAGIITPINVKKFLSRYQLTRQQFFDPSIICIPIK